MDKSSVCVPVSLTGKCSLHIFTLKLFCFLVVHLCRACVRMCASLRRETSLTVAYSSDCGSLSGGRGSRRNVSSGDLLPLQGRRGKKARSVLMLKQRSAADPVWMSSWGEVACSLMPSVSSRLPPSWFHAAAGSGWKTSVSPWCYLHHKPELLYSFDTG